MSLMCEKSGQAQPWLPSRQFSTVLSMIRWNPVRGGSLDLNNSDLAGCIPE
jgi:hypothetical protein